MEEGIQQVAPSEPLLATAFSAVGDHAAAGVETEVTFPNPKAPASDLPETGAPPTDGPAEGSAPIPVQSLAAMGASKAAEPSETGETPNATPPAAEAFQEQAGSGQAPFAVAPARSAAEVGGQAATRQLPIQGKVFETGKDQVSPGQNRSDIALTMLAGAAASDAAHTDASQTSEQEEDGSAREDGSAQVEGVRAQEPVGGVEGGGGGPANYALAVAHVETERVERREKSLSALCRRFVEEFGNESKAISLDEAADKLCSSRRRIYDIVNIMESIRYMSRVCKNTYKWHGDRHLQSTLRTLQVGAVRSFAGDAAKFGMLPLVQKAEESGLANDALDDFNADGCSDTLRRESATFREKEKSLSTLCKRFIQLYLAGFNIISVTEAAQKLKNCYCTDVSTASISETEKADKTRSRRLYDVANVLANLKIIAKIYVPGQKSPSFTWISLPREQLFTRKDLKPAGLHDPSPGAFADMLTAPIFPVASSVPAPSIPAAPSQVQAAAVAAANTITGRGVVEVPPAVGPSGDAPTEIKAPVRAAVEATEGEHPATGTTEDTHAVVSSALNFPLASVSPAVTPDPLKRKRNEEQEGQLQDPKRWEQSLAPAAAAAAADNSMTGMPGSMIGTDAHQAVKELADMGVSPDVPPSKPEEALETL